MTLNNLNQIWENRRVEIISYALVTSVGILASITAFLLYNNTRFILEERLKERLRAIVSTAALQFDPLVLSQINDSEAAGTAEYKNTVLKLQLIRENNLNVKYAYILRPNSDPTNYQFIADADSMDPSRVEDYNNDGVIDEIDQLSYPGDVYDVSEIPALISSALGFPTTDEELTIDQWGTFLSSYAPIRIKGETVAVIGIDVEVSEYEKIITRTFIPFALFTLFLFLLIFLQAHILVGIWRKQVDLIKELDHQKDELLGLVSHQLATPISGLKWNLEMFIDGDLGTLNEKQMAEMKTMQGVAGNLADLASMILDVSRIQLGKMKIDKSNIDIKQFFVEIFDVVEQKAKEKKIEFKHDLPANLKTGFIDKRLTHMTIENLVSNAIKYTPNNGKVLVDTKLENGILKVMVKDTGVGIPKADQAKIFGKLYRASNVAAVDGNGFGLFIAKGAIEAQGGKIWFESEEGKGTAFYVELPIVEQKAK